jgi:hypothetical protein
MIVTDGLPDHDLWSLLSVVSGQLVAKKTRESLEKRPFLALSSAYNGKTAGVRMLCPLVSISAGVFLSSERMSHVSNCLP